MGTLYRPKWMSLRSGDRFVIGESLDEQEKLCHIKRYEFASNYVKDKIVLDAGCGAGYGSRILKQNGASLVIGVDYSEEAISYARKKYGAKDVLFYTCNLCGDIDFTKDIGINHFDVIASIEVIEHTPSPDIYLSNLYKLLAKGGFIVLSTPNKLTDKHVLCHEKEFSIEELHTYIHTYIHTIKSAKLYGQRIFSCELKDEVVNAVLKEIDLHTAMYGENSLKAKVAKFPVIKDILPFYSKIKKILYPLNKDILDNLSCNIKPVAENVEIPYTQIVVIEKE